MIEIFYVLLILLVAIAFYLFVAFKRVQWQFRKTEKKKISPFSILISLVYFGIVVFVAWQIFSNGLENVSSKLSEISSSGLFEKITALRSQWSSSKSVDDQVKVSNQLDGAVSRLLLVVENYPQIKANTNFLALQDEFVGTENRIAVSRKDYNDVVGVFNAKIQKIPTNIIASLFNFHARTFFEAEAGSEKAVKVSFAK